MDQLPPDRGHLATEKRLAASACLDVLSVREVLQLINDEDAKIAGVVREAIPQITQLVETTVTALRSGGRLIYIGAGTSGRLGVLDASECPPTYQTEAGMVVGIIAGGDGALRKSSEGREDEPDGAADEFARLKVSTGDVVVGIAAGGTTPYVQGGLRLAHGLGAQTGLLACVSKAELELPWAGFEPGVCVCLPVGAEVVTGSTRMKAGTATKLALNMITTGTMVQLGKTWGNLMVDLRASNAKLRDRAARILMQQCDLSRAEAFALLERAQGHVKSALVMHQRGVELAEAQRLLTEHQGRLRTILGEPR